ncbi:LytTR family DNA-binding domain-containing protein [Chryseobacterium sp. T16E-39]|uniref:LytTR family DNA-binding domain-containing protein n=1 Tax=Chryseobacterium sp. T16E-39 TaxID=2015076 RepID=UPI0012F7DBA8|nr:LytTR family DNA-binding domain-containing protein [Chryseobacterium sp. T16E-39]
MHDVNQYPLIQSQIPCEKQLIFIRTEVKADNFNFEPMQLIFAKADGNYTEITFKTSDGIKKEVKRITLRQFELQIMEYKSLFRCHRTYLLNVSYINSISGNSQNCFVTLIGTTEKVPVSRAKIKMFHELYPQNKNIN